MAKKPWSIPKTLKELAIAEFIRGYFGTHSAFPSNEEIVDHLRAEFAEDEVGPLYPKDITNLKKGAYKLLDINVALPRSGRLEVELREALDLDGAIVVGSPYRSYDTHILRNIIGYQAARFFDENVKDGETVTFSCSMTIREMIKMIHESYQALNVLTDSVVAVDEFHVMSPANIAVLFLDRFPGCRGTAYTLPTSLVEQLGREAVQKMLDEALFEQAFHANWVFVGIGALTPRLEGSGLTPGFDFLTHVVTEDALSLAQRGVVGEISYWPLDATGRPIFQGAEESLLYFKRVFTYSDFHVLDRQYRCGHHEVGSRTRVVGAAGGLHKVDAIRAAARYLDYLVTDVKTAEALINS
jgi:DNA-binding transcriptional regulator LsrR (DeoR family)